ELCARLARPVIRRPPKTTHANRCRSGPIRRELSGTIEPLLQGNTGVDETGLHMAVHSHLVGTNMSILSASCRVSTRTRKTFFAPPEPRGLTALSARGIVR